ncbi:hypothetical protein D3C77_750550 [compost metagenome]
MPMLVSRLSPLTTAQVEQPLPRWAVSQQLSSTGRLVISAARLLTKWWLVPWKP